MAVLTHLETDTGTNVDISGATAVGAYTANGDKLIMVDVSIDAVAGNGDYVMYVTRQIGGSGSAYRILPQTTMAAASGLTAISGQSGWITVRNGDVLTCYVDGLAGDTSTPDWSTRWFESAVTLVTLADDAITSAKFDESTAYPLKSADTGSTQVARVGADSDTLETLSDEIAAVKAETALIVADTNELQTDLVNGGRLDLLIDSIITHLTDIKGAGWSSATSSLQPFYNSMVSALSDIIGYTANIKGAGWTDETLVKIITDIAGVAGALDGIGNGASAQEVWEYVSRTLTDPDSYKADVSALATTTHVQEVEDKVDTADAVADAIKVKTDLIPASPAEAGEYTAALTTIDNEIAVIDGIVDDILVDTGTTIPATLATLATAAALDTVDNYIDTEVAAILAAVDTEVAAIKAKTDNLPASPAAVGSAMTLTAAYDKAKDDVLTPLAVVDGIVDAIKVQTDKIPATPASAGEYTANIGAIKAKTDNLPLSPASSGEYTSALTAIQNDLDNPNQYKADVSGLATQASVNAIPTTPLLAANYTAPDNATIGTIAGNVDDLETRLTAARAGYLDKLNVSGTLAHSNDAATYKADVSGLATSTEVGAIALLGETVIGSYTVQDILKILAAKMVGKATGGSTATITYRGVDDTSDVIIETVDSNGNRSAVTLTV